MTFDEISTNETAMGEALRSAGVNTDAARLRTLFQGCKTEYEAWRAIENDKASALLLMRLCMVAFGHGLPKAADKVSARRFVAEVRKPPRESQEDRVKRLAPIAAKVQLSVVANFIMRDGRNLTEIRLDEIDRLINQELTERRQSGWRIAVLKKVKEHCGGTVQAGVTIGDAVKPSLLKQWIDGSKAEAA